MKRMSKILLSVLLAGGLAVMVGCPPPVPEVVEPVPEKWTLAHTEANPPTIDPAVGWDFASTRALTLLYDTLVYPDTTGAPQPHVAESWETSPDGKIWTFLLRSGIKFHDGTELTAEDVAFSMDRLLTIGEGWSHLFADRVERVKVIDRYTVRFYLTAPFGPFLTILYRFYIVNKDLVMANIVIPGPYGEFGDFGKAFLVENSAGSGPFMVKRFPFWEYILMERFPHYWGYVAPKAPWYVKQIPITEAVTVRTLMAKGEIQITDQWQSPEALKALDAIEGVEIARLSLGGVFHYLIHTRKPPTDCIHVRRALAWATDYETLVTKILPGFTQARGPVSSVVPGHDPTVFQFYFDLDRALEELRKSRYYDRLDQYPIEIYWVAEVPVQEKIALMMLADFAKIGITARVVKAPWLAFTDFMLHIETSPHLVPLFPGSDFPEAGAMLHARYHSLTAATFLQNEWLLDPVFDRTIEDALSTVSPEERFAKYAELQHYIVDLSPTIFLADDISQHAYRTDLIDWPAARGEGIPIIGYDLDARWIQWRVP
jgi:peptide/nickel transport system substrate-binding protein